MDLQQYATHGILSLLHIDVWSRDLTRTPSDWHWTRTFQSLSSTYIFLQKKLWPNFLFKDNLAMGRQAEDGSDKSKQKGLWAGFLDSFPPIYKKISVVALLSQLYWAICQLASYKYICSIPPVGRIQMVLVQNWWLGQAGMLFNVNWVFTVTAIFCSCSPRCGCFFTLIQFKTVNQSTVALPFQPSFSVFTKEKGDKVLYCKWYMS